MILHPKPYAVVRLFILTALLIKMVINAGKRFNCLCVWVRGGGRLVGLYVCAIRDIFLPMPAVQNFCLPPLAVTVITQTLSTTGSAIRPCCVPAYQSLLNHNRGAVTSDMKPPAEREICLVFTDSKNTELYQLAR